MGPIGKTKAQILEIMEPGSNYGYSVWRKLQVRYGEEISLQAIYQHLEQLTKMGLIQADEGRNGTPGEEARKYFILSRRGRRVLRSLDEIRESVLADGSGDHRDRRTLPRR